MMLLYLQLTLLRFAVPADAAAVRGASRPGAHRGHHEALGEHRGQLDTAAVIGPILGAGVATVITLVYQGCGGRVKPAPGWSPNSPPRTSGSPRRSGGRDPRRAGPAGP